MINMNGRGRLLVVGLFCHFGAKARVTCIEILFIYLFCKCSRRTLKWLWFWNCAVWSLNWHGKISFPGQRYYIIFFLGWKPTLRYALYPSFSNPHLAYECLHSNHSSGCCLTISTQGLQVSLLENESPSSVIFWDSLHLWELGGICGGFSKRIELYIWAHCDLKKKTVAFKAWHNNNY